MRSAQNICDGCGRRKARYRGRKLAAASAASARRNTGGEPIEAYHCPGGHGVWHIGHPVGWRREQGAA